MSILTLSGWTQPHDVLQEIVPETTALDYHALGNEKALFLTLAEHNPTVVIAWSLGGQLTIKAVAAGHIAPQKLVIIAAPYQFVACDIFVEAMDPVTYQQFRDNYIHDTQRTANRFHGLVAKGDSKHKQIIKALKNHPQLLDVAGWLPWLEELGVFSARDLTYDHFPPTLLIHGSEDAIVPAAHSHFYAKHMPDVAHEEWKGCAHAPHLHDAQRLRSCVLEFIKDA